MVIELESKEVGLFKKVLPIRMLVYSMYFRSPVFIYLAQTDDFVSSFTSVKTPAD